MTDASRTPSPSSSRDPETRQASGSIEPSSTSPSTDHAPSADDAPNQPYTPGQGLPLGPRRGLPLALPPGFGADPTSSQVSDPPAVLREPNAPGTSSPGEPLDRTDAQPSHGGHHARRHVRGGVAASTFRVPRDALRRAQPARRLTNDRLAQLSQELGGREQSILELLAVHRFLTTHQIQFMVFTDHASEVSAARTTRRVLSRLERWGLLRMLHRRVGGVRAGSSARIWQLSPAGARLARTDGSAYRVSQPSLRFLRHCLAVADVHVLFKQHEAIETIERVDVQVESQAWRRYTGAGGEPRWLQPDLAATVLTPDYLDRWFVEVDLGTESLPTLLRKCAQYEDYRDAGLEQSAQHSFPLVLWIFDHPQRAEQLRRAVASSRRLSADLYRYATPHTVVDVLAGGAV